MIRLWLSYQRYAVLLGALTLAIPTAILCFAPTVWWLYLLAAYPVIRLAMATVGVHRRWPEKLRATRLADRRIAADQFTPKFVENYCEDPCFRVVARELLRRAGYDRRQRRAIVREFARQAKANSDVVLLVDHQTGVVTTIEGRETR
jgi:hypothetical protein